MCVDRPKSECPTFRIRPPRSHTRSCGTTPKMFTLTSIGRVTVGATIRANLTQRKLGESSCTCGRHDNGGK